MMEDISWLQPPRLFDLTAFGLTSTCLVLYASYVAWDVFLGPLSHIPGPKLWAASYIPKAHMLWTGSEARTMQRLHEKYGSVVRIAPRELNYTDAAVWKDIYGHKSGGKTRTFEKDTKHYVGNPNKPRDILTATGAVHTRHRRVLANSFSDKALRDQEPLLKRWAGMMILKLKEVAVSGEAVDVVAYYNFTTFDIWRTSKYAGKLRVRYILVSRSTASTTTDMNVRYNPWVKTIFGSIKAITKLIALKQFAFVPWLLTNIVPESARKKQKEHAKFSTERVDRRLAKDPGRPDLWTEVLKRSDVKAGDAKSGMSLGEMYANAAIFMLGGTETTATLLSGLTYYLLMNPDKMAKLVAEVRETFVSEGDITVDELARLPYLNACIEEGLRMYPPVPGSLPRKVPKGGALIAGKWIPGNVTVAISNWAINHSATNFRHHDMFVPERWMGDPKYASDNRAACQPFSTGSRNCIGKNLAYHEMRLLLSMTLFHFDLTLENESADWSNQKIFLLWDKKPLMVRLRAVSRV
ncbi:benzoate 4-monooxygenase cytochrome P450 [Aureobasidium subglaciale]|nr:benzoate 4-monooxygenase cytochrome P450 [Aureobasidium subglaciale]